MEVKHMDIIVHALCLNMIKEDEISNYSFISHVRYTYQITENPYLQLHIKASLTT